MMKRVREHPMDAKRRILFDHQGVRSPSAVAAVCTLSRPHDNFCLAFDRNGKCLLVIMRLRIVTIIIISDHDTIHFAVDIDIT